MDSRPSLSVEGVGFKTDSVEPGPVGCGRHGESRPRADHGPAPGAVSPWESPTLPPTRASVMLTSALRKTRYFVNHPVSDVPDELFRHLAYDDGIANERDGRDHAIDFTAEYG